MKALVEGVLNGNRRALARMLTYVENRGEEAQEALAELFPHTGRAWIIGVTGAPGTGKSSLVNALAKSYRTQEKTVGIIAVDPTSPFSGGAILGDRIRMRDLAGDSGVFIRSMATRGNLGGLALATRDVIRVMDAGGFDVILVETVGAGQSEVDIVRTAQTTLVVEAPGLGDDVQAIKAGILEIADILVVNKADRPGADNTVRSLRSMIELGHPVARTQMVAHHGQLVEVASVAGQNAALWIPPIIRTIATDSDLEAGGIATLNAAIEDHRQHLTEFQLWGQLDQQRIQIELYDRLRITLMKRLLDQVPAALIRDVITRVQERALAPQHAAEELLAQFDRPVSMKET